MSERNSTVPIRRIEVSSYTVPADFPVNLNPNRPKTRIAKNPEVQRLIASGHKLTTEEQKEQYKKIVQRISALIGNAGVSIEVFADLNTTAEQMLAQGQEMFSWVPNGYVKYPCTHEGLRAAQANVSRRRWRCVGAGGERHLDHLLCSFALGAGLATAPSKALQEWAAKSKPLPEQSLVYKGVDSRGHRLKLIQYKDLNLNAAWESFDLNHSLTKQGIQKFVADYESTLRRSA